MVLPEPVWGTKLHILGINGRKFRQLREKALTRCTLLEAKGDISNPVGYSADVLFGERIKTVQYRLFVMDEMTEAALEGESVGQFQDASDNLPDGCIDVFKRAAVEFAVSLDFVLRIVDKYSGFCEGLH